MSDLQKVLRMRVSGVPTAVAHTLTLAAADGYQYGGNARVLAVGGGAAYTRRRGAYTDVCLMWLDPAKPNSLFHSWLIRHQGSEKTLSKLVPIIEYENHNGFMLVDLVPLEGFMKDEAGPGTVAYFAIFERKGDITLPMMLDRWVMKEERLIDEESVPCQVIGCDFVAPRMSKEGVNLDNLPEDQRSRFMCPKHRIYISPTTFEYENLRSSLLWQSPEELKFIDILEDPANGKRTWNRMGRERDEDSLTWNVFRCLDRNKMLGQFLEEAIPKSTWRLGSPRDVYKIRYWSVDLAAPRGVPVGGPHRGSMTSRLMKRISLSDLDPLKAARASLGESETYGSEPDLILVTDSYVILLEVKFTAPVITQQDKIPSYYLDDKEGCAAATFTCDPAQALDTLGYELFRFFLLGEALGRKMNLIPVVVLLTRDGVEPALNTRVQSIIQKPRHAFAHITWGDVHKAINRIFFGKSDPVLEFDQKLLNRYLKGKTSGYDSSGKLTTLL